MLLDPKGREAAPVFKQKNMFKTNPNKESFRDLGQNLSKDLPY